MMIYMPYKLRIKVTDDDEIGNYYCEECQKWFDEPKVVEWDEDRGEYWGAPAYEHMIEWNCPFCGGQDVFGMHDIILEREDEE